MTIYLKKKERRKLNRKLLQAGTTRGGGLHAACVHGAHRLGGDMSNPRTGVPNAATRLCKRLQAAVPCEEPGREVTAGPPPESATGHRHEMCKK